MRRKRKKLKSHVEIKKDHEVVHTTNLTGDERITYKRPRRMKDGVPQWEPPEKTKKVGIPKGRDRPFTTRSRPNELAIVKAMLDALAHTDDSELIHDILVETLTEHKWVSIYLRATLDPNKSYGLKSRHLKKINWGRSEGRMSSSLGFWQIMTRLQLEPREAAKHWKAMIMELPDFLRDTANLVLDKNFKPITRVKANKAMRECDITPLIPRKEEE